MEKVERLNWSEASALAVGVTGIVATLLGVFSPWPWDLESPWTALSAVATLAAVVVALAIPYSERLRRDRADAMEAALLRHMVEPELAVLFDRVRAGTYQLQVMYHLQQQLSGINLLPLPDTNRQQLADIRKAKHSLERMAASISIEICKAERTRLSALSMQDASAIARIIGRVPLLVDVFEKFSSCSDAETESTLELFRDDTGILAAVAIDLATVLRFRQDHPTLRYIINCNPHREMQEMLASIREDIGEA